MMECFPKDLGALPREAQEMMSLQRESFLEDLRAEVADKRAKRFASANIREMNEQYLPRGERRGARA